MSGGPQSGGRFGRGPGALYSCRARSAVVQLAAIARCAATRVTRWEHTARCNAFSTVSFGLYVAGAPALLGSTQRFETEGTAEGLVDSLPNPWGRSKFQSTFSSPDLMATVGQFYWPSVGTSVAAYGQFLVATNKR